MSEFAIAVGMYLGYRSASAAAALLLLLFIGVAWYAIRMRLSVPCNCFGDQRGTLSIGTIHRNLGLLCLVAIGAIRPEKQLNLLELLYGASIIFGYLSLYSTLVASRTIRHLIDIGGLWPAYRSTSL